METRRHADTERHVGDKAGSAGSFTLEKSSRARGGHAATGRQVKSKGG